MIKIIKILSIFLSCFYSELWAIDILPRLDDTFLGSLLGKKVPLSSEVKQALEDEEKTLFNAPVILHGTFEKPTCEARECQKKVLLGIGLSYQGNYARSTSGDPGEIIDSKKYFPYFENRKNLNTSSIENEESTALAENVRSVLSGTKTSVVFFDGHGIKEVNNSPKRGILLPEKSVCRSYQHNLNQISAQLKATPPNSPSYGGLINQYKQGYMEYSGNFCHDRFLSMNQYEAALGSNQSAMIYFNSAEPLSQIRSTRQLAQEYGLFSSIDFVGGSIPEIQYSSSNYNELKSVKAYLASSNYMDEFKIIRNCDNDIDKNGQIQLHEVNWQILKQATYTDGLKAKAGKGGDSLYKWQSVPVRKDIQLNTLTSDKFWSNPGKYLDNYKKTTDSIGFSVIFNVNNLNCTKFAVEDSPETVQVLRDSPLLRNQKITLLDVSKQDLDLSNDDLDFFGKPPKATVEKSDGKKYTQSKNEPTIALKQSAKSGKSKTEIANDISEDDDIPSPAKKEILPISKTKGQKIPTDGPQHKYKEQMYKQFIKTYGEDQGIVYAKEFEAKMQEVSAKTGLTMDQISTIAYRESGFNPKKPNNGYGYFGLFQFGADAAKDVGTTTSKIRNMTPAEQLDLYVDYQDKVGGEYRYSSHVLPITKTWNDNDVVGVNSKSKLDLLVHSYKNRYRPITFYTRNKGMDINKDGVITVGEMNAWGMGK